MIRAFMLGVMVLLGCAVNAQTTVQVPAKDRAIADALGRSGTNIFGNNLVVDSQSRVLGIAQIDGKGGATVSGFPISKRPKLTCLTDGTCGGAATAVSVEDWRKRANVANFEFVDSKKDAETSKKPVCTTSCTYVQCDSWHDKGKMCPRICTRSCTDG